MAFLQFGKAEQAMKSVSILVFLILSWPWLHLGHVVKEVLSSLKSPKLEGGPPLFPFALPEGPPPLGGCWLLLLLLLF